MRAARGRSIDELDGRPPPSIEPSSSTRPRRSSAGWPTTTSPSSATASTTSIEDGDEAGLKAVAGVRPGHPARRPDDAVTKLTAKALAVAREPHVLRADEGQLARAPSTVPPTSTTSASRGSATTGGSSASAASSGSTRRPRTRRARATIPLLRGKVERRARARRRSRPTATTPRRCSRSSSPTRATRCSRSRPRSCSTMAIGILGLGERQRVRLFVWRDPLERFVECLVCIPRDRFNTENRETGRRILIEAFGGGHARLDAAAVASRCWSASTTSSGSPTGSATDYRRREIEARLVQATRAWADELRAALIDEHGEEDGLELFTRATRTRSRPATGRTGSPGRRSRTSAGSRSSAHRRRADHEPVPAARSARAASCAASCSARAACSLSEVLPTFEHMGAKVVDERPYEITPARRATGVDLRLRPAVPTPRTSSASATSSRTRSSACGAASSRTTGSTGWCSAPALTGREVTIIRAIAKYLRQAGIAFSDSYMERTLLAHPEIAALLVRLFDARFDPDGRDQDAAEQLRQRDRGGDRRRRRASTRTGSCAASWRSCGRSCARTTSGRRPTARRARTCRSSSTRRRSRCCRCRGRSSRSSSTRRAWRASTCAAARSPAAGCAGRTGREDFRTEVLGLMKAQMVKNALIVPVGAKGGFVVKRPPADGGREALLDEGIACYRTFLSGLLDITDNIVEGEVVPPERVVRYDDDDPYLVVAADKGTATFSDIANERLGRLRLLARRRVRLGRLAGLRPQADGDHRARRVGVGQAPLPRARHRHPDDRLHGRRDRRHVRRRVRQRDAALARTSSCSPRSTTCTCSSIPTRIRRRASPSAGGCSSCRARRGATTTSR